ncbi:hypothetical protein [Pseudomonas amygdali]|uniref:hypothetical protein n=1 Tax=Pseudomonas amygdali TaxID=47877 RepID=UPI0001CC19CE|nr:hypothetical protein [Pseudomonas amygdali]KWT08342.1 hypothetical protein AL041_22875 [Pseudomonas amygdali pv. aesculi]KWT16499.1 hypothetical protein AL042_05860 [Pseudomonas amygdali pv. aesculi]KWT27508.1 hypothetical protein AL043_15400 [Pseudomonas amygdali pv. aesculi]KWT32651.1 hypothetical protein AL044_09315 [Pseudomonas amygdali pv. aesculi]KWT32976.1 hypothetical protein AMC94_03600 [Pseudomonas amygdali pv. aesculi]
MIKVQIVDKSLTFIVSLLVTYPIICLVLAATIYSFVPDNNHGIKTIPLAVYSWIEGQKHKDSVNGYLNFDKCLDAPASQSANAKEIKPCQSWGSDQISVNDAANMAVNVAFLLYFALVMSGVFLMLAVKVWTDGMRHMLMPTYNLFKELFVTLYGLIIKKTY